MLKFSLIIFEIFPWEFPFLNLYIKKKHASINSFIIFQLNLPSLISMHNINIRQRAVPPHIENKKSETGKYKLNDELFSARDCTIASKYSYMY